MIVSVQQDGNKVYDIAKNRLSDSESLSVSLQNNTYFQFSPNTLEINTTSISDFFDSLKFDVRVQLSNII